MSKLLTNDEIAIVVGDWFRKQDSSYPGYFPDLYRAIAEAQLRKVVGGIEAAAAAPHGAVGHLREMIASPLWQDIRREAGL